MELRRTSVPDHVRDWVKDMTGSTVVRTRRLPGATSAALHRLDLADGSRLVLRRYAWRAYREAEPEAPRRETDALCFARSHGLAVPEVVAADVTGDHVGDGVPVVLVAFLPGRPEAVPDMERLAEVAASIHEISADDLGHEYFPWYEEEMTTPPPLTERRGLWELAIELWRLVRNGSQRHGRRASACSSIRWAIRSAWSSATAIASTIDAEPAIADVRGYSICWSVIARTARSRSGSSTLRRPRVQWSWSCSRCPAISQNGSSASPVAAV